MYRFTSGINELPAENAELSMSGPELYLAVPLYIHLGRKGRYPTLYHATF